MLLLLLGGTKCRRAGGQLVRTAAWPTNWISGLFNGLEVGEKLNGRCKNNYFFNHSHILALQFSLIYINNFYCLLFTGHFHPYKNSTVQTGLIGIDGLDCTFRSKRSQIPELLACARRLKCASSTIICLHSNRPPLKKRKKKGMQSCNIVASSLGGSAESHFVQRPPLHSTLTLLPPLISPSLIGRTYEGDEK